MNTTFLKIHAKDNVLVALSEISAGTELQIDGFKVVVNETIPQKHKLCLEQLEVGKEVVMYGVKLLGVNKPTTIEVNEIESKMLKSFYRDSKKVNNKKMKEFFNYKLKYPTYVEGLNSIFNNNI